MTPSNYTDDILYQQASLHSFLNYEEVKKSRYAACYYCKNVFLASIINKTEHCVASNRDGTQEPTVFCPFCEVDYIIGDASGFPVRDTLFLEYMKRCNNKYKS